MLLCVCVCVGGGARYGGGGGVCRFGLEAAMTENVPTACCSSDTALRVRSLTRREDEMKGEEDCAGACGMLARPRGKESRR